MGKMLKGGNGLGKGGADTERHAEADEAEGNRNRDAGRAKARMGEADHGTPPGGTGVEAGRHLLQFEKI